MIEVFKSEIGRHIEKCIKESRKEYLYIYEDKENKGIFVSQEDEFHLKVHNSKKLTVYLLQNENCSMSQRDGKQIDWLIFNKEVLCFIENKSNVGKRRRSKSKREAYIQLENALVFYKNVIQKYEWKQLVGVIVIEPSRSIRTPSAEKSTLKAKFKLEYSVDVLEKNSLYL
jgi:hypothetical protein